MRIAAPILGLCHTAGSLEVVPFALDPWTGASHTLPVAGLPADRAGHFSAAATPESGAPFVAGFSGPPGESLPTIDLTNRTFQASDDTLPSQAFAGILRATRPL